MNRISGESFNVIKILSSGIRLLLVIIAFIAVSCHNRDYVPKPSGYFRIDFPEKKYTRYSDNLPYSFDYPVYAEITKDTDKNAEPYWINIEFKQFNGKIHLSYKRLKKNDLANYIEDARKLAYKHTIKADAIEDKVLSDKSRKVYGILYDIKGNTASSVQFFVTDSTKNFLRGALYFNSHPNKDSLAPVVSFFRKDIDRFIETLEWK